MCHAVAPPSKCQLADQLWQPDTLPPCAHACPQTTVTSNGNYAALAVTNTDAGTDARSIEVLAGMTELGQTTVTSTAGPALTVTGSGAEGTGELAHGAACVWGRWLGDWGAGCTCLPACGSAAA